MKHTLSITIILVVVFFITQIMGLYIVSEYIDIPETLEKGEVSHKGLPFEIERPPIEKGSSFAYIMIAILIGTLIILFMIKLNLTNLWKFWFFLSVWICLTFAFNAFTIEIIAAIIALVFAIIKVAKPNIIVHNITEVFIYGGLAAIFVPIMNVFSAIMILLLISAYDMFAVWKSKHMIKLAKFQTKSRIFAGLYIPYKKPKFKPLKKKVKLVTRKVKHAILGGGDVGFPLIFAGVVMEGLLIENGLLIAFLKTLIIPICATIALFFLFMKSKDDKFYPAMPFISIGCLIGFIMTLFI